MNITLRKANAIQSSINELLNSIQLVGKISINEFQDPSHELEKAQTTLVNELRRKCDLLNVRRELRTRVAAANAQSCIDENLTTLASLDKSINLYTTLLNVDYIQIDYDIITGKLDKIRNGEGKDSYGFRKDSLETGILHQKDIDGYKSLIGELKRQKQNIQDKVLELNIKTEIELSDSSVDVLKRELII